MTVSKRLKILVVAHELSPVKGSESAVGWNIVTRLSKYHDVFVFFASGSQFRPTSYVDAVNEYFKVSPRISGIEFINIDDPKITRTISRVNYLFSKLSPVGLPVLYYLGYKFWQKEVLRAALRMHATEKFDVVHQLTQITFREPGYLWQTDLPFVWGPTGGTSSFPMRYNSLLSGKSILMSIIRRTSNLLQYELGSRIGKAMKRASVIYTFSGEDLRRFRRRSRAEIKIMLDVGTSHRSGKKGPDERREQKLTGIWCGRLDDFKAPSILLKAIKNDEFITNNCDFIIIGTGPLEEKVAGEIRKLGIPNVKLVGSVNHREVFQLMDNADFLVHTSIQEATSSVIPEALSMGLPVICHDAFGMSIAVNETCGIKVPLESPAGSISGFNKAISRLVSDKNHLRSLKEGALIRSEQISWDVMAETMAKDYTALTEPGSSGAAKH